MVGSDKVKTNDEFIFVFLESWKMLMGFNINDGLSVHLQMIGAPLVNELTENKWQHHRGINSASKDGSLQATQRFIHMVNAAQGTIDQRMYDVYIIDSGATLHCTGNRNLLSEYTPKEQPDESYSGVSGKVMPILGIGTICNGMFQVKDVKYMPSLNPPNINKTIFSVVELGKLGYHTHFDGASCSVIDTRNRTWSWKAWTWTHEIVGEGHLENGLYMVDYLRIPADRVPVINPEGPTLAVSFRKAVSSGWARVTGLLTQTQEVRAERLPV